MVYQTSFAARTLLLTGILSVLSGLSACAGQPATIATGADAEVSFDGLHRLKGGSADAAWARPDLDLTGYSKIMLESVGIEYRPGGKSGTRYAMRSDGGPYEVTEEQKAGFRELVRTAFREALAESRVFTLVSEPGPDVLLIKAGLLDVVSYVPPESTSSRTNIYLREVGEATLVLEIRDSVTDAILVRGVDRRAVERSGGTMMNSNSVNNRAEVQRLVRRWGNILRDRLESFKGFSSAS